MRAAFVNGLLCHPHCWCYILTDFGLKAWLPAFVPPNWRATHLESLCSLQWIFNPKIKFLSLISAPQPLVKLPNHLISSFPQIPQHLPHWASMSPSHSGFSATPLSLYVSSSNWTTPPPPPPQALPLGKAEGRITQMWLKHVVICCKTATARTSWKEVRGSGDVTMWYGTQSMTGMCSS